MTSSTKPVALMTGAASGIGAAIARRLAADRFAVVLDSRSSAEAGRAMAAAMTNAIYIQTDLADEAARVQLIDQAAAQWGRLDLIVNNAGVSRVIPHGDLAAATPEIWRELHEVNVIAPWHLIPRAEPQLRRSDASWRKHGANKVRAPSPKPL
jgi:NAD(P)-dependent dehydrogenase (short-subunit alcohol dehydrogenase family)